MPRAYSYLRFSTPEQSRGDSYRRQTEAARAYAESRELDLDETLKDEGVSGYTGENVATGALGRFLQMVAEGEVERGSVLIVESLDRLSREQAWIALEPFLGLIRRGVEIVTLAGAAPQVFNAETLGRDIIPVQLLTAIIAMSTAHGESALKATRVRAAFSNLRDQARSGGGRLPGRLPAWLRRESKTQPVEIIPERAAVVRHIFDMCIKGTGVDGIAATLTREGVPPFGKPDRREGRGGWYPHTVGVILRSPTTYGAAQPHERIAGGRSPAGDVIPGIYPAAVTRAVYERAQVALAARRGTGGPRAAEVPNLFAGTAKCGFCGGPMSMISKGRSERAGRYLYCDNSRRGGACENPRPSVNYGDAEEVILDGLNRVDLLAEWHVADRSQHAQDRLAELRRRLVEDEETMRALAAAFRSDAPEAVTERIRELATETTRLRREVTATQREVVERRRAEKQKAPFTPPRTIAQRHAVKAQVRAILRRAEFHGDVVFLHPIADTYDGTGTPNVGFVPVDLPPRRKGGWTARKATERP